jgi:hypothetical protein
VQISAGGGRLMANGRGGPGCLQGLWCAGHACIMHHGMVPANMWRKCSSQAFFVKQVGPKEGACVCHVDALHGRCHYEAQRSVCGARLAQQEHAWSAPFWQCNISCALLDALQAGHTSASAIRTADMHRTLQHSCSNLASCQWQGWLGTQMDCPQVSMRVPGR